MAEPGDRKGAALASWQAISPGARCPSQLHRPCPPDGDITVRIAFGRRSYSIPRSSRFITWFGGTGAAIPGSIFYITRIDLDAGTGSLPWIQSNARRLNGRMPGLPFRQEWGRWDTASRLGLRMGPPANPTVVIRAARGGRPFSSRDSRRPCLTNALAISTSISVPSSMR